MKSSRVLFLVAAVAVNVSAAGAAENPKLSKAAQRGKYLVAIGGCNDCHTPMIRGPQGPTRDMTKMLSGHPEAMKLPPAPQAMGPWIVSIAASNTAFQGPWGTSYAANLTSDEETGIGKWTEQQFIQAMRTGKHLGAGRPILPPMSWPSLAAMTDEDLKAVFAYLKSTPPLKNKVPETTPPAAAAPGGAPPAGPPGGAPPAGPPASGAPTPPPGK